MNSLSPHDYISQELPFEFSIPAFEHVVEDCQCKGKHCPKCDKVKCYGAFNHNRSTANGLQIYCQICQRLTSNQHYRKKHPRKKDEVQYFEHVTSNCQCSGKWCPACKMLKCHGTFNFSNRRDGFQTYCKDCHAKHTKAYREAYPEKIQKLSKAYQQTEQRKNYRKEYEKSHPEQSKVRQRRYRQNHLEDRRANDRALHKKHRPRYTTRIRMYQEAYRKRTLPYSKAYHRTYRQNNRQKFLAYAHTRRTRKTQAGGSYTDTEWETLKAKYDYRCLRCGKQEPEIRLTADHIIPVTKHGSSNIDNIQPLCKPCNSRKHNKIIDYRLLWLSKREAK